LHSMTVQVSPADALTSFSAVTELVLK